MRGGAKVYKSSSMETHVHFFICSYGSFSLSDTIFKTNYFLSSEGARPALLVNELRHKEEELQFLLAPPRGLPESIHL